MKRALGFAGVLVLLLFLPAQLAVSEEPTIPEWVKTTVKLWSEGKISHHEFVNAIDYLQQKNIIKLPTAVNEDVVREIEYLQAKTDVFKEELQQLRKENEEYRILLKSQQLSRDKLPPSLSNLFEENQNLKNEVMSLRQINKQFSQQIDSWITTNAMKDQSVSFGSQEDSNSELLPDYQEKMDSLQKQNINYEKQINDLKNIKASLEKKVDLLFAESENNKNLLKSFTENQQQTKDEITKLLKEKESYQSKISQLESQTEEQKKLIDSFSSNLKDSDGTLALLKTKHDDALKTINQLVEEREQFQNRIQNLEGIADEQKNTILTILRGKGDTEQVVNSLEKKMTGYENKIQLLEERKSELEGKISSLENENTQFKDKINKLEFEKEKAVHSSTSIKHQADETEKSVSLLNSQIVSYKGIIDSLVTENNEYKKQIDQLENENNKHRSDLFAYVNNNKQKSELLGSLNSKVTQYENKIKTLENKNEQLESLATKLENENYVYGNKLSQLESENLEKSTTLNRIEDQKNQYYQTLELLKKENQDYEKKINSLRAENEQILTELKYFGKKELAGKIDINDLSSENERLKNEITLLQTELQLKQNQISGLLSSSNEVTSTSSPTIGSGVVSTTDAQTNSYQEQIESLIKQNESYLVELNYLNAKNIVNEEEMNLLRSENEEYRVLINLLKKGKDYANLNDVKYQSIKNGEAEGVVISKKFDEPYNKIDPTKLSKIDRTKQYLLYLEPIPKWSEDISFVVFDAVKFWESAANVKFGFVESSERATAIVSWYKELPNDYDGFVIRQRLVQIGLGSSACDGTWHPYDSKSIRNVLIHELGHVLGLEHTTDQSDIMYPVIHNAKFASVNEIFTLDAGQAVFIDGCSLNPQTSFQFDVVVQDSDNKIDLFFVPSKNEYLKFVDGKSFQYYTDPNCIGLSRSGQVGICKNVDNEAGLLLIAPKTIIGDEIKVKVSLSER